MSSTSFDFSGVWECGKLIRSSPKMKGAKFFNSHRTFHVWHFHMEHPNRHNIVLFIPNHGVMSLDSRPPTCTCSFKEKFLSYPTQWFFLDKAHMRSFFTRSPSYPVHFMKWLILPRKAINTQRQKQTVPTFFWLKSQRKILKQLWGLNPNCLRDWLTDVLTITPQVLHRMQGFILQWCPM